MADDDMTVFAISIHAPRAGSDISFSSSSLAATNFNPRSPCGERLVVTKLYPDGERFQSTLPVRGATRLMRGAS